MNTSDESVSELVIELHTFLHTLYPDTVSRPDVTAGLADQMDAFLRSVGFLIDDDDLTVHQNQNPIDQIRHALFLLGRALAAGKLPTVDPARFFKRPT